MPSSSGAGGTPPRPVNAPNAPTTATITPGASGVLVAREVLVTGQSGQQVIIRNALIEFISPGDAQGATIETGATSADLLITSGVEGSGFDAAAQIELLSLLASGTGLSQIALRANQLQLGISGTTTAPIAGSSGFTTVAQVVSALQQIGLFTP